MSVCGDKCGDAYLFVQTGLDMKRFIRHDKVAGGFKRGRHSLVLRSVLDLPEHQLHRAPVGQRREVEKCLGEAYRLILTVSVLRRMNPTHRLRTLASWLSALNALISNSTAHCYRRREKKRRHHPAMCSLHHHESSVRFLPCRHHGALAEEPLSKAGCRETEGHKNIASGNQRIRLCALWLILYGRG